MSWLEDLQKNVLDLNNKGKIRAIICENCPERSLGICKKCGCFLSIKVMLPESKCPLNKW